MNGQAITSTVKADGRLVVELAGEALPVPVGHEVLVRVEAAAINPSDLGVMFGPADLERADYAPGRIVARLPEAVMAGLAARVGTAMRVGNEGAGTVIAAGEQAQDLVGRRVTCLTGGMFASHRLVDARACMVLPEGMAAEAGAAAFVNPLTALGFVETMRREGFTGIVHTAAASNLGQMLVRLCRAEGVPLVCVVRSAAQAERLRGMGADYVVNSAEADFDAQLTAAIRSTGAMLGFDAIGGGTLAGRILMAMERAVSEGATWSRYGTDAAKKVYIYGALDTGPTALDRRFGFTWGLGGWLLFPFLQSVGTDGQARLRQRVADGLGDIFASRFTARVTLADLLTREVVLACNAKVTGAKYLLVP